MSGITMITSVLIEMLAKVWQINYFIQVESIFIRNFVSMEKNHDHHFSIMSILNFSRKAIGWKKKIHYNQKIPPGGGAQFTLEEAK